MDTGLGQQLVAVRVKDGIFVGNLTAALDEDFLVMNKVTHIVNCAGTEIKDMFEDIGIEYLTFNWRDGAGTGAASGASVMFDNADRNIEQVVRFVDQGLEGGACVLIHSYFGVNRSCALLAAYLMVKFGWKLENTLAFMSLAHQDMAIKPHFLRQLKAFGKRHDVGMDVFSKDVDDQRFALDNDQWMLRNTFLNGLTSDVQARNELFLETSQSVVLHEPNFKSTTKRRRRLLFVDTKQGTSVASTVSQPYATSSNKHADPYRDPAAPRASLLARRSQPNSRRLESPTDVNPRGRQVLTPKRSHSPVTEEVPLRAPEPAPARIQPPPSEPAQVTRLAPESVRRAQPGQGTVPQLGAKGSIRSPFALSYTSGGAPRNGSPMPQPRAARRSVNEERTSAPPSSYSALQNQLRDPPRTSSPRPVQRTASPVKRQPVQSRLDSPRTRTDSPRSRLDSPRDRNPRVEPQQQQQQQPRAGSPMGGRLVFQSHPSIPNANATIVSNSSLRGTSNLRPYSAVPVQSAQRADSPMSQRRTSSPMVRDRQPARRASPAPAPQRAGSPMTRTGPGTGSPARQSSLADQYLGTGGGAPRPRETTASMLRRQQNLAAHR